MTPKVNQMLTEANFPKESVYPGGHSNADVAGIATCFPEPKPRKWEV